MVFFFFFKQKTAYEMRISDWSSDVCSSDLRLADLARQDGPRRLLDPDAIFDLAVGSLLHVHVRRLRRRVFRPVACGIGGRAHRGGKADRDRADQAVAGDVPGGTHDDPPTNTAVVIGGRRSEEHTSELQSLMRNPYAVFCLK